MKVNPEHLMNNWVSVTPVEEMAKAEYDVLIIGTGAGGGAVTWRLCEQWGKNNKKIGVIESGDFLLPTQAANIPTMTSKRMQQYHEMIAKPLGESLPDYREAKQVFAFGGRTLFWNAVSPRLNAFDIADWPVSFQEMESYYNIAEQVMNVTKQYTEDSTFTDIMLKRLHKNGFPEADATPLAADLSSNIYEGKGADVFFSSVSFFAEALNYRDIDLAVKTRAVQILVEKDKVVGVKVISQEKKTAILKAKQVVLSASTFETPRLLLYSGINGRAIGHYLMNHSFIKATGKVSRREFPGVLGALGILIPSTSEKPYQIQLRGPDSYFWHQPYEIQPLKEELEINFLCFGEVEPRFANKVTLDSNRKDPFGVPEISVDFSFSKKDQAIIRQTAAAVKQIASFCGIKLNSGFQASSVCLMPPGDLNHDSGTCRMGDDPMTSAVNKYGQIHGMKGLYVADNSVFPSIGAANLTLSTAALAIRTADYIISQE